MGGPKATNVTSLLKKGDAKYAVGGSLSLTRPLHRQAHLALLARTDRPPSAFPTLERSAVGCGSRTGRMAGEPIPVPTPW
jgi:hypothetical protein